MNKKHLTLIASIITTFNLIQSMELPLILTPHSPTSQKDPSLWKVFITDDRTMYQPIEPTGCLSNTRQNGKVIAGFSNENLHSCTMILSPKDQCFGIEIDNCYVEKPIKLTRKQIEKIVKIKTGGYSIILLNESICYDIQRIIPIQESLLEQIHTTNTTMLALARKVLAQECTIAEMQELFQSHQDNSQVADVTEELLKIEQLSTEKDNLQTQLTQSKEEIRIKNLEIERLSSQNQKMNKLSEENNQPKTRHRYFIGIGIGTIVLLTVFISRYLL